jgi:mannitol-1-/sugar-/sorbitol-6-phosphatase
MVEVRVRGLLFDSDGVLVDSTELVIAQWRVVAGWYGLPVDELLANMHGRRARDVLGDYADRLPVPVDQALDRMLSDPASMAARTVPVLPGARELLGSLPGHGWAVVTSGGVAVAPARLASAGLPAPPVLVTADDVPAGKPDPAPYLVAAKRLGLDAADCLVFEDAPPGLVAARAAGAQVVALRTTYPADQLSPADHVVTNLAAVSVRTAGAEFVVRLAV